MGDGIWSSVSAPTNLEAVGSNPGGRIPPRHDRSSAIAMATSGLIFESRARYNSPAPSFARISYRPVWRLLLTSLLQCRLPIQDNSRRWGGWFTDQCADQEFPVWGYVKCFPAAVAKHHPGRKQRFRGFL